VTTGFKQVERKSAEQPAAKRLRTTDAGFSQWSRFGQWSRRPRVCTARPYIALRPNRICARHASILKVHLIESPPS
jgi:hypothetical protein